MYLCVCVCVCVCVYQVVPIGCSTFFLPIIYHFLGGARGVMVIVAGYGHGDTSSNPHLTDCISHSTNTLGKGLNPNILPPAMGK